MKVLAQHLEAIDASIAALDQEIATVHAQNPVSRLLASIPGIGKITASAIVASVPVPSIFKSGRDFSAWLGSTPRQNSSGGKEKLGSITKQGNRYLRRLLVLGATSLLRVAGKRKGALGDWLVALLAQTRATGHGGARQQARADHMGRYDDRRDVSNGNIRESIERRRSPRVWREASTRSSLASAKNDVMTDTVATEGQGHPACCHERQSSRR